MTFQEAKNKVLEQDQQRHKDDMKIFYPDPVQENDCAQCGKPKELHLKKVGLFFCNKIKIKPYYDLMDEAAELYARSKWDEACTLQKKLCDKAQKNEIGSSITVAILNAPQPEFE